MMNYRKYEKQYFMPPVPCMDWTKKEYVDKAPIWCSVDLRDETGPGDSHESGAEDRVLQASG